MLSHQQQLTGPVRDRVQAGCGGFPHYRWQYRGSEQTALSRMYRPICSYSGHNIGGLPARISQTEEGEVHMRFFDGIVREARVCSASRAKANLRAYGGCGKVLLPWLDC